MSTSVADGDANAERTASAVPHRIIVGPTAAGKSALAMDLARDRLNPSHLTRAMIQGFIYNPEGAVEAGYLDMLAEAGTVEAKAIVVASQLAQLPAPAYAWNKAAIRKPTLDRIRASLGAHHKL